MPQGLLLRIETAEAVASQQKLTAASNQAFDALGKQDQAVKQVEQDLRKLADAGRVGQRGFEQVSTSATSATKAVRDLYGVGGTRVEGELAESGKRTAESLELVGTSATKTSRGVRDLFGVLVQGRNAMEQTAGSARNAATGVQDVGDSARKSDLDLAKLAGGGVTGAVHSLGRLVGVTISATTVAGLFASVGFGVGKALTDLASSALDASSRYTDLLSASQRQTQSFTLQASAIARLSGNLKTLSASTDISQGFTTAEKEAERLERVLSDLSKTQTELARDIERQAERVVKNFGGRLQAAFTGADVFEEFSTGIKVSINDIETLLEVLQAPPRAFADLERAARGQGQVSEEAFARLREEIGLQRISGTLVVDATKIQQSLIAVRERALEQQRVNNERLREEAELRARLALQQIEQNQQQQQQDAGLGPRELEAVQEIRRIEKQLAEETDDANRKLTEGLLEQANQVRESSRALDQAAASAEAAAKAKLTEAAAIGEAEKARAAENLRLQAEQDARESLNATYQQSLEQIQLETALLTLNGREREQLRLTTLLTNQAREAGLVSDRNAAVVNQAQQFIIASTVARLLDQRDAAKQLEQAEADLSKTKQESIRNDARRVQIISQLNGQTDALLATTQEEIREKTILAQINDRLAATGGPQNAAFQAELELAVRRNEAAKEYRAELERVRDIGAQVGQNVAGALIQATLSAGDFTDNLKRVTEQLLVLEAQRRIIDLLRLAGSSIAGSLFGPTPPAGPTPPGTTPVNQAFGSVLPNSYGTSPFAQSGLILDRSGIINYRGRGYNVAEGGASTPEAIVPLQRDQFGRLGLLQSGTAATYNLTFPSVRSAEDARRVRPTIRQTLDQVERAGSRWRGGIRGGR